MDDVSEFFQSPVFPPPFTGELEKIYESADSFTEIYRGRREGKFRAFKCLKPQFRGNPVLESLLRKEYATGYSLSHPNICEYYGFPFLEDLGNCIEMEWIDGCTLDRIPQPDETQFQALASQLCDAVQYLHSRQIQHRDIKPSNILVTYNGGNVKLIDFSLSDGDADAILKEPAGTRRYAAPEVLAGKPADCRSDLYSLGIVLKGLTKRHKKALRDCCRHNPDKRTPSAAQLKKELQHRPSSALLLLPVGILAAAVAIPVLIHRPEESVPAPISADPAPALPDSSAIQPPAAQKDAVPATKRQTAPQEKIDTADIGAIFRQASELFE